MGDGTQRVVGHRPGGLPPDYRAGQAPVDVRCVPGHQDARHGGLSEGVNPDDLADRGVVNGAGELPAGVPS